MSVLGKYEFWLVVGSQHLYGPKTLEEVAAHAREMVAGLAADPLLPSKLTLKKVGTTAEEILAVFREANASPSCAGIITWMHTFSPSKMWIAGLAANRKPLLHFHTQYHRDIPWSSIDMDFMNLNQAAHGDREHGFIHTRMGLSRKVVVGHWKDPEARAEIGAWMRAAAAFADGQERKVVRFGDNMREVAVTEGNKVSAQIAFGWSVNGYGLGDLARELKAVDEASVDRLVGEYRESYVIASEILSTPTQLARVREQARIELAMRAFLESRGAGSFTTTFEDLAGLPQLPGLAVQRLMAAGYGFGAEGDWKTAALLRAMKVMGEGLPGGSSFMEDYTYNMEIGKETVLGAHMLEVCPSIAAAKPRVEVHPLGIGGKDDPARLVFEGAKGPALNASLLDLGDRFRLLVNEVESVGLPEPMPKLPVARVVWRPKPSFKEALKLWILAGGAHHTGYSTQVGSAMLEDWARMAGIEFIRVGEGSDVRRLEAELGGGYAARGRAAY
ncbi:MAG TPA: L-arabinose isomerase [Rectinemataceae bacterium]|nr:L-arabinose isomerase [Rectinemataceae bacterium]